MKMPMHKVIEIYYKNNPKGHWFSEPTMRFFKSTLADYGYRKSNDIYFITGERFNFDSKRYYTVRRLGDKVGGDINTVGEFNELTRDGARRLLAHTLGWKIKDL